MRLRWAAPTALVLGALLFGGCGSSTTINATPQITGLFPSEITAGSQGFTLFVGGTQFISTSTVQWNGSNRPSRFNSASTQLSASITAADVQNPGIASVTVTSPSPGGGVSLAVSFTIDPVHSGGPTITGLSPSSAALNSAGFTLMVTGTNFAPTDFVTWNGGLRTTTFTSATQLSAAILSSDLTQQMTASVAVHTSQLGVASPSMAFQVGSSTSSAVMPEVISVNAFGGPADGASTSAAVSGDGRFVAFRSEAKNLVSSGASGNIFVRDTCLGVDGCAQRTVAVDLAPDGSAPNAPSGDMAISVDGRYVAFASRATNLSSQTLMDSSPMWRVFVRDTCLGSSVGENCSPHTEPVSFNAEEALVGGFDPAMSVDGRFVAFAAPKEKAVLVRDTCHGTASGSNCIPRSFAASVGDEATILARRNTRPAISQDGRYVAFVGSVSGAASPAANARGPSQVFLRDTCSGVRASEACTPSTNRISVAPDGAFGNGNSGSPSVSADGRFVVFGSAASNLVFDSNGREDIYLRDTCLGSTAPLGCSPSTTRISRDADLGEQTLGSYSPTISPSGRYISYAAQTARESASDSSGSGLLIVYDTCFGAMGACSSGPAQVTTPDGSWIALRFGNTNRNALSVTTDGRFVVFFSPEAFAARPTSGLGDIFLTTTPFASRRR